MFCIVLTLVSFTGFVPKSQNYFSHTYAETCREALSEFDRDQQRVRLASAIPLVSNNTISEFKVPSSNLSLSLTYACMLAPPTHTGSSLFNNPC